MDILCIIFFESIAINTIVFLYLKHKAKLHKRHLYKENIFAILFSTIMSSWLFKLLIINELFIFLIILPVLIVIIIVSIGIWRFYRDPERVIKACKDDIVSPADGQIIYIKNLNKSETPFSVKGKNILRLEEITKTNILNEPCFLVGIVMTVFDVHVNRAPIKGKVILNKHINGKFLSLKLGDSDIENERCTIVIENEEEKVGVVLIASKRIRRIISFVKIGQLLGKGDRIGVIKFGSQIDLIIPQRYRVNSKIGEQVFAGKTVIASLKKS